MEEVKKIGRIELAALRAMAKGMRPYVKQMSRIDIKLEALLEQKDDIQKSIDGMSNAMSAFVGEGNSWESILYPETIPAEVIEGELSEETVDMTVTKPALPPPGTFIPQDTAEWEGLYEKEQEVSDNKEVIEEKSTFLQVMENFGSLQ